MEYPPITEKANLPPGYVFRVILYSGDNLGNIGQIEMIREFIPKVRKDGCVDRPTGRCFAELLSHIASGKFANVELSRKVPKRERGRPRGLMAQRFNGQDNAPWGGD